MTTLSFKLPQVSRVTVERAAPLVASLMLFGLALMLPPVGHRLVPLPVLIVHAAAAISSVILGAFVLFRRKGDALHKRLGKVWVLLMLIASFSSFGLQARGHLSIIHLLGFVAPVYMSMGIYYARRGEIAAHRRVMRGVYGALIIAGVFAIGLPGRALTRLLFGA